MTFWVFTYLDNYRPPHGLGVFAATPERAHLFIRWSKHKPVRKKVYRRVRGTDIWCGYRYWWKDAHLHEQTQSGNTYEHLFGLIPLDPWDHVWYYLFSIPHPPPPEIPMYPFEHQGPLIHVAPPELHHWTRRAYVGTKLTGIYYTDNFTGPLGDQPTWRAQNFGLHSLRIWQLEPDPQSLHFRIYALAGPSGNRILYYRVPGISPAWVPILSNTDCLVLTGAISGEMCWVATNRTAIQHLYVLFNSAMGDVGTWCLKSINMGRTWTAHQIYAATLTNSAGNISVGFAPGTSPHPRGSVLYARFCYGLWWRHLLYLSTDWGDTWALVDSRSMQLTRVRCLVDPTDYSIVYIGSMVNLDNPAELFRSEAHGAAMVEVDDVNHLGIYLEPEISSMWIHETDHHWLTTLSHRHLWTTLDYCANWTDHGETFKRAERLAILSEQPEHLYLARDQNAYPIVHPHGPHVIYVSDDYGATMHGKAGLHPLAPYGAGDSLPYNCGGVCLQGMQLFHLY